MRSLVAGDREWPLAERGRWVLGRGSACDIQIADDDAVSRRHAEIAVRAGECRIRDLDSCNGTLLNGRPIEQARLRRGDVLLFGETRRQSPLTTLLRRRRRVLWGAAGFERRGRHADQETVQAASR